MPWSSSCRRTAPSALTSTSNLKDMEKYGEDRTGEQQVNLLRLSKDSWQSPDQTMGFEGLIKAVSRAALCS